MATQTEPRLPLSRDRILQAALDLADDGGIEALTMRKLGHVLGFEAMSLYNHVTNKDDVLDGILDLVLAETEPPAPTGDWDAAVRRSAISVRQALRRHPWACPHLFSAAHVRPARLRYMDLLLGQRPVPAVRRFPIRMLCQVRALLLCQPTGPAGPLGGGGRRRDRGRSAELERR